jgi:muramidase (phage lysozyme)
MTFSDKLNLSSFIIKRAYAGYNPQKPIPVPSAKPVPSSQILGPAISLLDAEERASGALSPAVSLRAPAPNKIQTRNKPNVVAQKAVNTPVSTASYYQPILDVIRKGESNVAGYNTMVGSNKSFGLTGKTLQQVLDIQKERLKTYGGTAAGGYQILNKNLLNLVKQHKHDLNKTLFDQSTQDTYGRSLMDRRGFKDFLAGKISLNQMRINLAKEWAALPAKGEKSYYHGTGNNAARVSSKDINAALQKALELHRKAVKPDLSQPPLNYNAIGELP